MGKKEFITLGELEARIMEIIWQLKSASVRDVLNKIKGKKKPAYTTIMTVMARLYDKGILRRKAKNDAYIYQAVQDKQSFFVATSKKIINSLISEFGEDVAVAGFIDAVEKTNLKKSRELRKKLKKIIK